MTSNVVSVSVTVTAPTSSSSRLLSPPSPETNNPGSLLLRSVGQTNRGTFSDKAVTKLSITNLPTVTFLILEAPRESGGYQESKSALFDYGLVN